LRYCFRDTPITTQATLLTLVRPAFAAVIAGAALWIVQSSAPHWPAARWIGLDLLIYGAAYLATWMIMPDGRTQLRQFVRLLEELRN
jgi:hypothetical protein